MKTGVTARDRERKAARGTGFTLVEILVTLVLVGILVTGAGMVLVPISRAFLQARRTAEVAQQAQLATARLSREFVQAQTNTISIVGNNSATYTVRVGSGNGGLETRSVSWAGTAGSPLLLGPDVLVDDVHTFVISHTPPDGAVSVRLRLAGAPAIEYRVGVYPRN